MKKPTEQSITELAKKSGFSDDDVEFYGVAFYRFANSIIQSDFFNVDKHRLDSKVISISGTDEFGEKVTTIHTGIDLRMAIDKAIKYEKV